MNALAPPPIARCPACGGWLARRALHSAESPTVALTCGLCAWDGEIIAGQLVPITRPASTLSVRERRS